MEVKPEIKDGNNKHQLQIGGGFWDGRIGTGWTEGPSSPPVNFSSLKISEAKMAKINVLSNLSSD